MPKLLDETRVQLDVGQRGARLAVWDRLLRPWCDLWRRLLAWLDCHFHWWRRLTFAMQAQLQSQWCWAANSTSVSHYYDSASPWTQCSVVNAELNQTTCCVDGSTSQCNQPWYLDLALTRTGNFASVTGGTATMAQIQTEILKGRPVGARIGWSGGGGHFVMIAGYRCDAVGYFDIRDPIYGSSDVAVATFTTSYQGSGSWTHTYYTEA
jgi:Papain-like cysteine protease AvrRpt2